MKKNNKKTSAGERDRALHYLETFAETIREPFLILDPNLRVVGASPFFYKHFEATKKETVGQHIYDLGNKQWDIPELKKLLEEILPKNNVFNDFEVIHDFLGIGSKTMLLNARRLDETNHILLAIEDITEKKELEKKKVEYTERLERRVAERTKDLAARVKELEVLNKTMVGRELRMVELKKEIADLKKWVKKTNGNHKNGQ